MGVCLSYYMICLSPLASQRDGPLSCNDVSAFHLGGGASEQLDVEGRGEAGKVV